jgi:hypothetical protein
LEIVDRLRTLAQQVSSGVINEEEAVGRAVRFSSVLGLSAEANNRRAHLRGGLAKLLGKDPETEVPEMRLLLSGLVVRDLMGGDNAMPRVATALIGVAVEGALREQMFGPYAMAVRHGRADAITEVSEYEKRGAWMLGTMGKAWKVLVTSDWAVAPSGLITWIMANYVDPTSINDRRLDKVDRVRQLRNRAVHFDPTNLTEGELEELIALALKDDAPLLPVLYRARYGTSETQKN